MRKRPLLLVVEDDEDTYELYSEFLASAGYEVHGASNGNEAVSEALRLVPDSIVLDVALPGRNGFEVARALKDDVHSAHIPILALTGFVQNRFVAQASEAGCDAFLVKPCPLARILGQIEELLDQHAARAAEA